MWDLVNSTEVDQIDDITYIDYIDYSQTIPVNMQT